MNNKLSGWNNLKYRTSKYNRWGEITNWMKFFIILGEYAEEKEEVDIYVSYLDEFYPALFISKGIIDYNLSNLDSYLKSYDINNYLKIGDNVTYLFETRKGKEIWKKAEVINIYNDEHALKQEWNPFIKLKIEMKKGDYLFHKIPKTIWNNRLRIASNYKNTAGSVVRMNKEIEGYLKEKYSKQAINYLQSTNRKMINICGMNIQSKWGNMQKTLEFLEGDINFTIDDFIFTEESKYSINNVNIIKTIKSKKESVKDVPTIFVGDNSSVTLTSFKTKKNIYLSNRKKNNETMIEILKQNIIQDSVIKNSENNSNELLSLLKKWDVELPRGVELYVY
ncbi:hypothetical protein ABDK10_09795 [Staphylococcus aureus]